MPEQAIFTWSIADAESNLNNYCYHAATGRLQCNDATEYLAGPASLVLSVLLSHPDAPVTNDDFLEAGLQTKGGGVVKKAIRDLEKNTSIAPHIVQVGTNKSAVYTFLTNPSDAELYKSRLTFMEEEYARVGASEMARKTRETLLKVGAIASVAAAAGYVIVKYVRKRTYN